MIRTNLWRVGVVILNLFFVSLSYAQSEDFKTIRVSVTAGGDPVTEGFTVACSGQNSPWYYASATEPDGDGDYICSVPAGSYYVYGYCTDPSSCDLSGYPSDIVSLSDSDTSVDASLDYAILDKTISLTLTAGGETITSGMTAYCYQQGGNWLYSSVTSPSGDTYVLPAAEGRYTCSAYCTDFLNCDVSGYPMTSVSLSESDTSAAATLNFIENDSTVTGVVTDGETPVANLWVSINAYQVSDGGAAAGATTQVSLSAMTNADGFFETTAPAGQYTITAYPPWERNDLASASTEATLTASQTTVVTLTLKQKTSRISGQLTDTNGDPVSGWINGWSFGDNGAWDWFWSQTDAEGNYTVYGVEGYTYNVMANPDLWTDPTVTACNNAQEGMLSVEASSSAQTVDFTFPICDCTMTVNAVDASSNILPQISGSVMATPSGFAADESFFGNWGWLSGGTGTVKVEEGREQNYALWFWDADYISGESVTATCNEGGGAVDLELKPVIDNAVSGSFVDSSGGTVSLDSTYIYVFASQGFNYRNCDTTASSYSCDLSEGEWIIGYWIDEWSGYASAPMGSSSSVVDVTSSGGIERELTLLRTGSIEVTVLNADGTPRSNVFVQAAPYASSGDGANDYQALYNPNSCISGMDGSCTIPVGTSAEGIVYYVNAYVPYGMRLDESLISPEEVPVTVVEGETATTSLQFMAPDGEFQVTLTAGNLDGASSLTAGHKGLIGRRTPKPKAVLGAETSDSPVISEATVNCFSLTGGSFEVTTNEDGTATCPCTTAHTWYVIAHNLASNSMYLSEGVEATCNTDGSGSTALTMDFATLVPEGKTVTINDAGTQSVSIELEDGATFFFPQGSLGDMGQVTVTVDVTITPITANKKPASFYGYSVYAFDSSGVAITQLSSNATFTIPYDITQIENLGLSEGDIETTYFDDSAGAYSTIPTATADTTLNTVTFTVNHLTDFAVVGNGFLSALDGGAGEPIDGGDDAEDGGTAGAAANGGGSGCGLTGKGSLTPYTALSILMMSLAFAGVMHQRRRSAGRE